MHALRIKPNGLGSAVGLVTALGGPTRACHYEDSVVFLTNPIQKVAEAPDVWSKGPNLTKTRRCDLVLVS